MKCQKKWKKYGDVFLVLINQSYSLYYHIWQIIIIIVMIIIRTLTLRSKNQSMYGIDYQKSDAAK